VKYPHDTGLICPVSVRIISVTKCNVVNMSQAAVLVDAPGLGSQASGSRFGLSIRAT
jgi:hypothetical protein